MGSDPRRSIIFIHRPDVDRVRVGILAAYAIGGGFARLASEDDPRGRILCLFVVLCQVDEVRATSALLD